MVGHNRKNANRAAGIAKNRGLALALEKRVGALEKEAKGQRRALEIEADRRRVHEAAFLDRLEALERSTYAKVRDWIRGRYLELTRRLKPAEAVTDEPAELEAEYPRELEADQGAELEADTPAALEIVEAPPTAEAERRAADLIAPPAAAELEVEPPSVGERFTTLKAIAREKAADTFDKGSSDD